MELIDGAQIIKFFAALTLVLGLMGGLALILKRFQLGGPIKTGSARRLKILEILQLDSRRKAILLRRDDKEHLVILGPNGETVIESGIISESEQSVERASTTEQPDEPAQKAA